MGVDEMTLSTDDTTPRPWRVDTPSPGAITVRSEDSWPIAEVWGNGHDMAANAALIVRAVNAHEALVAKLREAMRAIDRLIDASDSYSPAAQRSFEAHKAALSAAEILASLD